MDNPNHGRTMQQMVASVQPAPEQAGINYSTVPISAVESRRNWNIQANLGQKNFQGDMITRVELPKDVQGSQQARELEERRQLAQPWESVFMVTPTDGKRLNNYPQQQFVRQKQLAPPNTYGQFYAFMHALSAAFGTLHGGS